MPSEDTKTRNTQIEFHVSELEGGDCDPTGGPGAPPTVQPLWDAHLGSMAGDKQEDVHIQEGNGDTITTERRGYCREFGGNGVQLVWEGRGRAGGGSGTV